MFDKDITVINKYFNKTEKKTEYKVSYVKGFWSSNDGISISGTQLTKQDGLIARILMSEPNYQKPEEFVKKQTGWTLQNDDYLIKGKVEDFTTITDILDNYKDVMKITNISSKDYGSEDMWHFAVAGA